MDELAKNWWVKFAVGVAIMAYPATHMIVAVIDASKIDINAIIQHFLK